MTLTLAVTLILGLARPQTAAAEQVHIRRGVATWGDADFATLRHGIEVMMAKDADPNKSPADPTSWRFQAAMHGTPDMSNMVWNHCQHNSYYFFSWHRMYLYFFERILRKASGDPSFALPYWNYSDPDQRQLPLPFRQPQVGNVLYTANRAHLNDGSLLPLSATSYGVAFTFANFASNGDGLSFGGDVQAPAQFGPVPGQLELQPHNVIHGAIGGLMGDPMKAALDPIFYLHHANIDRLWNRWFDQGNGRIDPLDRAWRQTMFTFYDENGNPVQMSGNQVVATVSQLFYRYDDDTLNIGPVLPPEYTWPAPPDPCLCPIVAQGPGVQVSLGSQPVSVTINLTAQANATIVNAASSSGGSPLALRVTGIDFDSPPPVFFEIYANLPTGAAPSFDSVSYLGNLSFFGVKHGHGSTVGGSGMPGMDMGSGTAGGTLSYKLNDVVRNLQAAGQWNGSTLTITFVPRGSDPAPGQSAVPPTVTGNPRLNNVVVTSN